MKKNQLKSDQGKYQSWGQFPKAQQRIIHLENAQEVLPLPDESQGSFLPFGNGRSYGDSCLNDGGTLLVCRGLNRILDFDREKGTITCEPGILLSEILENIIPAGWFLQVTPGTKFVTLGGAIANDVHGKNHHLVGTFGRWVEELELLRSDGERLTCSLQQNDDWFKATIGGMGLTGVITAARIKLKKISSAYISQEAHKFNSLEEFVHLSRSSDKDFEYTVAWLDTAAKGNKFGRGIFYRGNHSEKTPEGGVQTDQREKLVKKSRHLVPINPPFSMVNNLSVRAFNTLYFNKQFKKTVRESVFYDPFFYPLDAIADWNRLYGPGGYVQHQSIIPGEKAPQTIEHMLETCRQVGMLSFLTVLKEFGPVVSPGMLSFPRPGLTMTLDFAYKGQKTLDTLNRLDAIVRRSGGAVNPYKDGRMSPESYQSFFPNWQDIVPYIDPRFSSGFWKRVVGAAD